MTNQEAIKVIRALWAYQEPHYTEKEIREALDLAIKALETPQVVLFAENITEEEKQKLITEFKAVMDNAKLTVEPDTPEGDLISREYMKKAVDQFFVREKYYHPYSKGRKTMPTEEVIDIIDNAPTVDISGDEYFPYRTAYFNGVADGKATAIPKGEWIDEGVNGWKCDKCGYGVLRYNNTNFCPKCGAKMGKGDAE